MWYDNDSINDYKDHESDDFKTDNDNNNGGGDNNVNNDRSDECNDDINYNVNGTWDTKKWT